MYFFQFWRDLDLNLVLLHMIISWNPAIGPRQFGSWKALIQIIVFVFRWRRTNKKNYCVLTWQNSLRIRFKNPIIDGASVPFQKGVLEGLGLQVGVGKPLIFFPIYVLAQTASTYAASRHPVASVPATAKKDSEPDLMIFDWCRISKHGRNSRSIPSGGQICVLFCFHSVKWGILGIRMVHGFGPDWGDLGEDRLIGEESAEWPCTGDLGRTVNFRLWQLGHNRDFDLKLLFLHLAKFIWIRFFVWEIRLESNEVK